MGPGSVWNGLDFRNAQNTKVCLPLMKPVQRILIGAEIFRQTCSSYRLLEHPAERQAIDDSALDTESDDSACVLVHDNPNTQYVCKVIDSQRNKSRLHKLSFT